MKNELIRVKVEAGARAEKFEKIRDGVLSIAVRENAEQNAANRRVRELVASHFGVPSKNVRIVSGHHKTSKLLKVVK